jgi:hypothetical protein
MKYLLATVAIAAMIASPVAAQAGAKHARAQATTARAQVATPSASRHSSNPANDVYDAKGQYLGSDPDSRIRNDMERERASFN